MPAHLLVAAVGAEAEVVHRHEDAPLRRLEAVAHVRQRPADDDAHRVVEVAILELVFDVERLVAVAVACRRGPSGGRSAGGMRSSAKVMDPSKNLEKSREMQQFLFLLFYWKARPAHYPAEA